MKTAIKQMNVPAYDRPTDLPDGDELCHGCGQTYDRARDGSPNHNFCYFCAPVTEDRADDGSMTWTKTDVQNTLAIVFDNEALAILRMAQV